LLRSALIAAGLMLGAVRCADAAAPLELETRIPLGEVVGRIDHLAIDVARRRLFVAELGNNSVDVVDLETAKPLKRLVGFQEPQGIGYSARAQTLLVASAGTGIVQMFRGPEFAPVGKIALGSDADNVRVAGDLAYVGYGDGAIAVIDAVRYKKIADIALPVHPEGFVLDADLRRLFVNLPDARRIAIADLATNKVTSRIATAGRGANFALSIDAQRLLVVFRNPPQLVAYAARDGAERFASDVCNDADDVFVDARRGRAYVSCGDGYVDAFALHDETLERIAHLRTARGARTSLFVPELDRLFVAVRAAGGQPAALWVYKPTGATTPTAANR
jgi:DNA-binding beta-propeller fold protein YncE